MEIHVFANPVEFIVLNMWVKASLIPCCLGNYVLLLWGGGGGGGYYQKEINTKYGTLLTDNAILSFRMLVLFLSAVICATRCE